MDEAEFTEWVSGCERQLLRSAYLLTGDLHRAQDLVQEALVAVALRWSRLRSGNPTAYARKIVVRDNVSWWRRHRRESPTRDGLERADVLVEPEDKLVVRRALARLTPAQRRVVVLRHFDDLTERGRHRCWVSPSAPSRARTRRLWPGCAMVPLNSST